VVSNDAISFPGGLSIWAAILEPILLQQVLGLFADEKAIEIPIGNRQMRGNRRDEFPDCEYVIHKW